MERPRERKKIGREKMLDIEREGKRERRRARE